MTRYRTAAGFLAVAALFGTSFPVVKIGLRTVPPLLFAALRYDVVAVIVLGYAVLTGRFVRPSGRDWVPIVAGGVFIVAANNASFYAGQRLIPSGMAAVVISTDAILAGAFSWLLLPEERPDLVGVVGLVLGLVGVAVVAEPTPGRVDSAAVIGVAFILGSAATWALGGVLVRRTRTDLPVESMQGWMVVVGAPLLHVGSVVLREPQVGSIEWTAEAIGALVYLAPVVGGAGLLLYLKLLDRIGPVEVNLISYTIPLFAAVMGWLLLDERMEPNVVVGFLIILAGFVLIKRDALRGEIARVGR